jgi:two-component system, OmpR family, manganese sensing response regulator
VNLLVVELESVIAGLLLAAGHEVTAAASGIDARVAASISSFDAIVVGRLGAERSGLEFCDQLRQNGVATPIFLLVESEAVEARVQGLDAGADDCLGLGCPADELLARLRALVRRSAVGRL